MSNGVISSTTASRSPSTGSSLAEMRPSAVPRPYAPAVPSDSAPVRQVTFGEAARFYFEHGASWGQGGPKRVITKILENTDKQSVLQHLKSEIKRKISLNRYAGKK